MIRLIEKTNGVVTMDSVITMDRRVKSGVSVWDIDYKAFLDVSCGFCDYACVMVDGEIYSEYES